MQEISIAVLWADADFAQYCTWVSHGTYHQLFTTLISTTYKIRIYHKGSGAYIILTYSAHLII